MEDLGSQTISNEGLLNSFLQNIRMQNMEELVHTICTFSEMLRNNARIQSPFLSQIPSNGVSPTPPRHSGAWPSDAQVGYLSSSYKQNESADDEAGLVHFMRGSDRSNDNSSFNESNYDVASSENGTLRFTNSISFHDLNLHVFPFNGFMVKVSYNSAHLLGQGGLSKVYRATLQVYRHKLDGDHDKVSSEISPPGSEFPAQEKNICIEVAAKKTFLTSDMLMDVDRVSNLVLLLQKMYTINHSGIVKIFLMFFLPDDCTNGAQHRPTLQSQQRDKIRPESHNLKAFNFLTLLEISSDGTLSKKLNECEQISETEIRNVLLDILPAVRYLHEVIGIVHNDIKPHNILLFSTLSTSMSKEGQDSKIHYKLGDFGHSKLAHPADKIAKGLDTLRRQILSNSPRNRTLAGTVLYMSPESCLGLDGSTSNDVWSIGITAFQLATGQLPWKPLEGSIPEIIQHGFLKKFSQGFLLDTGWAGSDDIHHNTESLFCNNFSTFGPILDEIESSELSPEFVDFVKLCLTEDFRNRPTCSSLLEHPFLSRGQLDMQ